MHIQHSLSLYFCILYLLLNDCDRNDVKYNALSFVDCWLVGMKKVGVSEKSRFYFIKCP